MATSLFDFRTKLAQAMLKKNQAIIAVCSDLFANGQTKAKAAKFAQLFPKMI